MARLLSNEELFPRYRFLLQLHASSPAEKDLWIGTSQIVNRNIPSEEKKGDESYRPPILIRSDTGGIWIGRAHAFGTKTLDKIFEDKRLVTVWMLGHQHIRKIGFSYSYAKWHPFDLNAAISGVALDWVLLMEVVFTEVEDITISIESNLDQIKSIPQDILKLYKAA